MELTVAVYKATADFPRSEMFGLTSQIRRAAGSIGYNIAEGSGRNSERQFLNSLQQASGEASELHYQLTLSLNLGYGTETATRHLLETTDQLRRMLAKLQSRIAASLKLKSEDA
jgi:four helix bundle protein